MERREGSLEAVAAATYVLAGGWYFAIDPSNAGEVGGWADPAFDDSEWARVEVPHTWNVMPEHAAYEGLAWYRRSFATPEQAAEALVRLRFEAVYYQARVWLNGACLGVHEGGYTPFEFDASAHLMPEGENVLVVQVDNEARTDRIPSPPMGWYNYGGLLRDVSLRVTSRAYVRQQRIVAVPHLIGEDTADEATVAATMWVRNTAAESLHGTIVANVFDDAGQTVLDEGLRLALDVGPGQESCVEGEIAFDAPKLWHFDHPHLYCWSATLLDAGGQTLHVDDVTFGVRSVQLAEGRFVLNGEPMRLVGFNRHADSPQHGPAETVEAMAADYDDMKRLNMVFTRPVHYPQHPFILDYCDRHGILMIPEVPAWQLRPNQMADLPMRALERQQLREMIESEWNHPSIWAWSVANEIASNTPEGRAFVRDMAAYAHEIDPTRPVSFASDRLGQGAWRDASADFVMMNEYYGMWHGPKAALGPVLEVVHASWPEKVVFVSEWGLTGSWRRGGSWPPRDPSRYYDVPEGTPPDAPEVDEVRCQLIADQMPVIRSKPFVAGAVFWCYQDYETPAGHFVMGVVDVHRNRRRSWHVIREEYAPILFESVNLAVFGGQHRATVALRTRGPVERDMPAYVLRGYRLQWAVKRQGNDEPFDQGTLVLPVLMPASAWSGEIAWRGPEGEHVLDLSIVRPTGFVVIEKVLSVPGRAGA